MVEQKFFQNLEEYVEDLTEIYIDYIKNKFSGQMLYTRGEKQTSGQYDFMATPIPEETRNVDYTFSVNLDIKTQYSKQASKELVKELYQIERQYDAPVKVMNIKDIITNYNLPNQDELVKRYDDLTKRQDEQTSQVIAQLVTASNEYSIDPAMVQQAIAEILAGKETPTVDQIMQMIEQNAQQQQVQQQQSMEQAMQPMLPPEQQEITGGQVDMNAVAAAASGEEEVTGSLM
jgi:hypothetical protein